MKTRHAILREEFSDACNEYFCAITEPGWDVDGARIRVAKVAIRLHLFEQGLRAGQRGRVAK